MKMITSEKSCSSFDQNNSAHVYKILNVKGKKGLACTLKLRTQMIQKLSLEDNEN